MRYGSVEWRASHHHAAAKYVDGKHVTEYRVCNFCKEDPKYEFTLPEYRYYNQAHSAEYAALTQAQRHAAHALYQEEQTKIVQETILPHLMTEHDFCICPKCQSLIKKSGLSSHKKSFSCEESNRQRIMSERGMVDVTGYANLFFEDLGKKANILRRRIDWEDYETKDLVNDALIEARRSFAKIGGLARVDTKYVNGDGWQECLWAPQSVAFFMSALRKRYPDAGTTEQYEERLYEMWQFLESDDLQRECAVGLLDLAMDDM